MKEDLKKQIIRCICGGCGYDCKYYDKTVNACNNESLARKIDNTHISEWIPCSDRLPNKEEYLKDGGRFILDDGGRFILDDGKRRYQGLFDIYDGKFKFAKHISGLHYELFEDNCVIAWMPLPEPYKDG